VTQQLFDPVRKKWVVATPEELIRQQWINRLHHESNFPLSMLSIEKKLIVLGLEKRYDLVAYNKEFKPYILMECKSENVKLNQKSFDQAARYNIALKAPFLIITNSIHTFVIQIDFIAEKYTFIQEIPKYI
jgi:hypothetical protein